MSTYLDELTKKYNDERRPMTHALGEACAEVDSLRARLAASESAVAGLRAALEGLLDEQNGVPLFTREKEYLAAVEVARKALAGEGAS